MKHRVAVQIAGQEYVLIADQDETQTRRVAAHVDGQIAQVLAGGRISRADGAVLAALNIADEYFKEVETAENLRRQLKDYLEDGARMKLELSEAKREIFKLQNKK